MEGISLAKMICWDIWLSVPNAWWLFASNCSHCRCTGDSSGWWVETESEICVHGGKEKSHVGSKASRVSNFGTHGIAFF